jgi:hypothetical protein
MENYKKFILLLGFMQLVHLLGVASNNAMQVSKAKNKVIIKNIETMKQKGLR